MSNRLALVLLALVAVALAALGIGLALGARAFVSNFLAGLVGWAISVLFAVLLIDVLLERRRAERWEAVRELTLRSIFIQVTDMAVDLLMVSHVTDLMDGEDAMRYYDTINGDDPRSERSVEALHELADFVRKHAEDLADATSEFGQIDTTSRSLYREIQQELATLRDVLTPRVLELGGDPKLAELLFEVERSERYWRHAVWLIENDWGMPDKFAWNSAATVYKAVANLAGRVTSTFPAEATTHADRANPWR